MSRYEHAWLPYILLCNLHVRVLVKFKSDLHRVLLCFAGQLSRRNREHAPGYVTIQTESLCDMYHN